MSERYFDHTTLFKKLATLKPGLSKASYYRLVKNMVADGELIKIGRDTYCVPESGISIYRHGYSDLAQGLAKDVNEQHPLVDFRIFETVQLNVFLNHLIGKNVIFLFVEEPYGEFLFSEIRDRYNNNVLINPTIDVFNQYWNENMIVIGKLPTESPKGREAFWHTEIEKLLVDIISENLIAESFSESEYRGMYEMALSQYVVDERQMFRYARRRGVEKKVRAFWEKETSVKGERSDGL